jgi:hypothetical protein
VFFVIVLHLFRAEPRTYAPEPADGTALSSLSRTR